jgi:hypothetical protein
VNETEDGAIVLLAKEAVIIRETKAVFCYFLDEGAELLVVVVEMDFDISDS